MALRPINATRLRMDARDLLEQVKFGGQRFVIATFGRPMAVLISFDDYQRVRRFLGDPENEPSLSLTMPPNGADNKASFSLTTPLDGADTK